jgi:hypothetical protein
LIKAYFPLNEQDIKIKIDRFDELLAKLNDNGYLLKKGASLYQVSILE